MNATLCGSGTSSQGCSLEADFAVHLKPHCNKWLEETEKSGLWFYSEVCLKDMFKWWGGMTFPCACGEDYTIPKQLISIERL